MKSIKILLTAVLTFALIIGSTTMEAQSSYSSTTKPMTNYISELLPIKAIGLDYAQSLIEINAALTKGVKSDPTVDFHGKLMVDIALNALGRVETISFDKNISQRLINAISTTVKAVEYTPVTLNGKAKAQTFKIPLIIK